jgi:hypothetical protein
MLANRPTNEDTSNPDDRGSEVTMKKSMYRPLALGHVNQRLEVNGTLSKTEYGKAKVPPAKRFKQRSGTHMERGKWHLSLRATFYCLYEKIPASPNKATKIRFSVMDSSFQMPIMKLLSPSVKS